MGIIVEIGCKMLRIYSSLRYVNCGPGHIQCSYISAYSGFSMLQNVSALLLMISRQFNERYTAILVPNTAHVLGFTLCLLWSRTYTMQLQLRIFGLHYSSERISAAIGYISTIQWALYCNPGAKYFARSPVYAMSTVVPDIYNVITVTYIQASIFTWRNLRCYSGYPDISMRVILQTWCQIQRTPSRLLYVNCGPGHIHWNDNTAYSVFNIQLNVSALLLETRLHFDERYTAIMVPNTAHILQFTLCELWSRDIQCNNSSAYSGFNIQLNVSALQFEISGQVNARYIAILVPYIAHTLQFTLCELRSRPYTM
jgi:hypothetical protein